MTLIALKTAGRVEPEESIDQETAPASVDVEAGYAVVLNSSSKWVLANAGALATSTGVYIAGRKAKAGDGLTAYRFGVLDGFILAGAYNSLVYLSDTDGRIADAAGTIRVVVGRVIGGWAVPLGTAANKLLKLDPSLTGAVAETSGITVLTDSTGVTPDSTIENVPAATAATTDTSAASLTSVNTSITAIENNLSDLAAKVNAILAAG